MSGPARMLIGAIILLSLLTVAIVLLAAFLPRRPIPVQHEPIRAYMAHPEKDRAR